MSLRHKAREFALQMLFQWEMGRQEPKHIEAGFWKAARSEQKTRDFANRLFEGAVAEAAALDALVTLHAENWRLERMAAIDRLDKKTKSIFRGLYGWNLFVASPVRNRAMRFD